MGFRSARVARRSSDDRPSALTVQPVASGAPTRRAMMNGRLTGVMIDGWRTWGHDP